MSRPPSILLFERLYLGSILLYVVNAVVFWSTTRAMVLQSPQIQQTPALASMMVGIMIATVALMVAVSLLLWWLVARARSNVGKWLVVVTEAIGAVLALFSLLGIARGTAGNVPGIVLGLLGTALAIAAAAVLFRADARDWLAGDELDETPA